MKIGKLEIKLAAVNVNCVDKAITPVIIASFISRKLSVGVGWWHFKIEVHVGWN